MNNAIVRDINRTKQHLVRHNQTPGYRSRLKRKALELLNRKGDRQCLLGGAS